MRLVRCVKVTVKSFQLKRQFFFGLCKSGLLIRCLSEEKYRTRLFIFSYTVQRIPTLSVKDVYKKWKVFNLTHYTMHLFLTNLAQQVEFTIAIVLKQTCKSEMDVVPVSVLQVVTDLCSIFGNTRIVNAFVGIVCWLLLKYSSVVWMGSMQCRLPE